MESVVNHFRSKAIINAVFPFIKDKKAKVLDIGAGSCHLAKTLTQNHGLGVSAVDVVDHNLTDFPLEVYDGKKLPYADSSFDIGLLIFVLHHASSASDLLKEAARVCNNLIIVEDLPGNRVERSLWKRFDYMTNHAIHSDIEVAHEAGSIDNWKAIFKKQDLRLVSTKSFRSFFTTGLMYPHVVFVVKTK